MEATQYNFDMASSNLLHITDAFEHPITLFEKWLKEAEDNDDLGWVKIINIATVHGATEVLSRNVIMRKFDQSGFVFVTERNSRKFADLKENPNVAGTFFWKYKLDGNVVLKQIRITGKVSELPPDEISKFYAEEGISTRIRCKICKCGQPCDWDELKKKHDEALLNFKNGTEKFEQNENYTALVLQPETMDFYFSMPGCIADRIYYTKDNAGKWSSQHIYA
ncbi:Pyridoxine/pyridoxamine 5'-phosphate oxidase [Pseudolycoriella hygida]|uniref:pyridoxal 5'-phosphate synthase n=1 Tax=Pseudolycoriella hygida TaxID=35572 RepID=A0A9Q0MYB9_9DIPT|nr:Pyridoxine/pyridoxamine 5'-phosphate oxidase [Pseudolycoriella hygida]